MTGRMTALLLGIVIALTLLPLVLLPTAPFAGADGQAGKLVTEIAPTYEPWAQPLWRPPSAEVESFLFALQAAVGAGGIGYFFGLRRGKRQGRKQAEQGHASSR